MRATSLDLFAIVAPGLETITAAELRHLGVRHASVARGGVAWRGDMRALERANLWLRTASRVVVRIAHFHASSFHELERRARDVPWGVFVRPGARVRFRVTCHKSRLYHSDAIAERLERVAAAVAGGVPSGGASPAEDADDEADSVLDSGGDAGAERATGGGDAQLFVVRLVHDMVTVSADSSGALLHRRGYRRAVAKAPLRETLAAAMLLGAGYDGRGPLCDPLCGSGTIAIEGALIARGIPPGRARQFAFMHWPAFDTGAWAHTCREALGSALPRAPCEIRASDRDEGAVEAARANAVRAGVHDDVVTSVHSLSDAASDLGPAGSAGWLVTNPPYGLRIGRDVRNLYARLGQVARRGFPGWQLGVLASDTHNALTRQIEVDLEQVFATSNGGIPVRFLVGRVP